MNSILSKPVLDAISFFVSSAPADATSGSQGSLSGSPFAPYKPKPAVAPAFNVALPERWTYPEPHQHPTTQFPELVTAFGEQAFAAYWQ
jgi:hypothetical protein